MRPKVSRGIKSTQSTKNLAMTSIRTQNHPPLEIQQLNLSKITSKRDPPSTLNTYRTQISTNNYTSRTHQTQREGKPLEPIYNENKKTYAEIQRERNTNRKSYRREGGGSRILMGEEENRFYKPKHKEQHEISSIELEIIAMLEQQNLEGKETIAHLRKQVKERDGCIEQLQKSKRELEMRIFEAEKEWGWMQGELGARERDIRVKEQELESALQEIERLRLDLNEPKSQMGHRRVSSKQFVFDELQRVRDGNETLIRQQEALKSDIRNIRKQNVSYRREIAKLKRELIERESGWLEMGERSSLRIAEGIRLQLKEFGQERNKQYEDILGHYKEEVEFLREKNSVLESKLQSVKQKQIQELLSLKRGFECEGNKGGRGKRSESLRDTKSHIKSRSMAMLSPLGLRTEEDAL